MKNIFSKRKAYKEIDFEHIPGIDSIGGAFLGQIHEELLYRQFLLVDPVVRKHEASSYLKAVLYTIYRSTPTSMAAIPGILEAVEHVCKQSPPSERQAFSLDTLIGGEQKETTNNLLKGVATGLQLGLLKRIGHFFGFTTPGYAYIHHSLKSVKETS